MGLRYQRRINLGGGTGLNISKSGISTSYRTGFGSFGTRGFSIRTGIPGLSFRSSYGKSKGNEAIIMLLLILFIGLIYIAGIVVWNILLFLYWLLKETYYLILKIRLKIRLKKDIEFSNQSDDILLIKFSENSLPVELKHFGVILSEILVENKTLVKENDEVACIKIGEQTAPINAMKNGRVTFYKFPGDRLKLGDYIYKIEKV